MRGLDGLRTRARLLRTLDDTLPLPAAPGSRLLWFVPETKPVLVASDVHLGAAPPAHEQAFMTWLDHAGAVASSILLNGDLFDFWFEYKWGPTRGHDAVLAKLRAIVQAGVPITLMGGNHDGWGGAYLRNEIGVEFLEGPVVRDIAGHRTLVAHGDGLGAGDHSYRVVKRVIRSGVTRTLFGLLPIGVGDRVAAGVSNTEERWDQWGDRQVARSDALETWAAGQLSAQPELDVVLLGHTHLPILREVSPGRWYVNSGDWVFHQSYVTFEKGAPPRLADWRER